MTGGKGKKPAPRSYDLAAVCASGRAQEFVWALDLASASPQVLDVEDWRCLHDMAACGAGGRRGGLLYPMGPGGSPVREAQALAARRAAIAGLRRR